MSPRSVLFASLACFLIAGETASRAHAAAPDASIDATHVSHVAWQDRRPICPVDQESFTVRVFAFANDLTSVRVYAKHSISSWVQATRVGVRGPYDVWEAVLPAATQPELRYYFELSDGPARLYWSASGSSPSAPADSGWVVDFATLSHAPLGATPLPAGGVVFRVWAPNAPSADVRGEFNAWGVTPMARLGEDFVARVGNAVPSQAYKYFFSSSKWSADARGRVLDPAGGYWNSRIADPTAFAWGDSAWQTPALDQMVVYQLNVGTFSGLNDPNGPTAFPAGFADLAARAGELRALGVNAVMLNPVTSTPSLLYAGYSTLNPWSPEWSYGQPDDFKAAVDALHREGIAVLCDIVWNHIDSGTEFLWGYDGGQPYFESPAAETPWGPQAAFGRPEVDAYFMDSALHWLEEYHVDGFRMDAVAFMAIAPHAPQGWALMQRFNNELQRRWHGKVTIAENFPLQGAIVTPTRVGGAGFAAEYNGDFRSSLRYAIPNNTGFSYSGYAALLGSVWSGLSAGHQSFNYFELHDDAWAPNGRRYFQDLSPTPGVLADTARARMRVAIGLLLLSPGVPAMLMGDEWLETANFGTSPAERIDWSKRSTNSGHYAYVRDLIDLRRHAPAFHADAPSVLTHSNYGDGVYAWLRYDELGREFLTIVNLGDRDFPSYLIGVPAAGSWIERSNSQASAYEGTGMVNPTPLLAFARAQDGLPLTLDLQLPRSSVVVLQALETLDAAVTWSVGAARIERAWPNPAQERLRIAFVIPRATVGELAIFDLQGRSVATLQAGPLAPGPQELDWDGRDALGKGVSPGVYVVRLRTSEGFSTRRIALVR